jgi:hypothetical protein
MSMRAQNTQKSGRCLSHSLNGQLHWPLLHCLVKLACVAVGHHSNLDTTNTNRRVDVINECHRSHINYVSDSRSQIMANQ